MVYSQRNNGDKASVHVATDLGACPEPLGAFAWGRLKALAAGEPVEQKVMQLSLRNSAIKIKSSGTGELQKGSAHIEQCCIQRVSEREVQTSLVQVLNGSRSWDILSKASAKCSTQQLAAIGLNPEPTPPSFPDRFGGARLRDSLRARTPTSVDRPL